MHAAECLTSVVRNVGSCPAHFLSSISCPTNQAGSCTQGLMLVQSDSRGRLAKFESRQWASQHHGHSFIALVMSAFHQLWGMGAFARPSPPPPPPPSSLSPSLSPSPSPSPPLAALPLLIHFSQVDCHVPRDAGDCFAKPVSHCCSMTWSLLTTWGHCLQGIRAGRLDLVLCLLPAPGPLEVDHGLHHERGRLPLPRTLEGCQPQARSCTEKGGWRQG